MSLVAVPFELVAQAVAPLASAAAFLAAPLVWVAAPLLSIAVVVPFAALSLAALAAAASMYRMRLSLFDSANWFTAFVIGQIYSSTALLLGYKLFKRLVRFLTGTTELFRICDSVVGTQKLGAVFTVPAAAAATDADTDTPSDAVYAAEANAGLVRLSPELLHRVDLCIMYSSKLSLIRREIESRYSQLEEPLEMLLVNKQFPLKGSILTPQAIVLRACLQQVFASYRLMHELNARAASRYDSTEPQNERKLLELWDLLVPDEKLSSRYTSQWQKIGFQGKDPSTDFRGMGLLALDDLHYLCKTYPEISARILAASHHPASWFSFAIVGINMTAYALRLVRTRFLQFTFYRFGVTKEVYHEVYCYLFDGFERFWTAQKKAPSILDFNDLFKKYQIKVEREILELKPPLLNAAPMAAEHLKNK